MAIFTGYSTNGVPYSKLTDKGPALVVFTGSDFAIVLDSDINLDVARKLPSICQPTLVIGGEKDPFYGAENIRETARLIPNAELRLLKNGGHAVVKTQTKAFESAILEFLQK